MLKAMKVEVKKEHQVLMVNKTTRSQMTAMSIGTSFRGDFISDVGEVMFGGCMGALCVVTSLSMATHNATLLVFFHVREVKSVPAWAVGRT